MPPILSRLSPYLLWGLLAVPAAVMTGALATGEDVIHGLLHPSGEFAARFMIIAMMATPLSMMFRGSRGPRWLIRNRRYFGVAAFGYAGLHTLFYLVDIGSVSKVLEQVSMIEIWTGWLAFVIFIPLAATSTDRMVRLLGRRWKTLQRWVYGAAVLTLCHWAALHDWGGVVPALVHFGPLAVLEAYRVILVRGHSRNNHMNVHRG